MDMLSGSLFSEFCEQAAAADMPDAGNVPGFVAETELQFYARRAQEESRLAKQAETSKAAAAHSYLAAAYSAAIAKELAKQREFEDLLLKLG